MQPQRNIIKLRTPTGLSSNVYHELEAQGYSKGKQRSTNLEETISLYLANKDPFVEQKYLRIILNAAALPQNHSKVLSNEVLAKLLRGLESDDPAVNSLSSQTLSNLSATGNNHQAIGNAGLFRRTTLLLSSHYIVQRERGIALLIQITNCALLQPLIEQSNFVEDIVPLIGKYDESFTYMILQLLQNIALLENTRKYLIYQEGMNHIIDGMKYSEHQGILEICSELFSNFSCYNEYTIPLGRMGIFPHFCSLLRTKNERIEVLVTRAITNLSADEENKIPIMKSGLVPYLIELLESEENVILQQVLMALGNLSSVKEVSNHISIIGACEIIANHCDTLNEERLQRYAKLVGNLCQYELARQDFIDLEVKKYFEAKKSCSNAALASLCARVVNNLSVPIRKLTRQSILIKSNIEKHYLKRIQIIQEILKTEQTYCHLLTQCVDVYMKPLQEKIDENQPLIDATHHRTIFSAIDIICQTHVLFLKDLEQSMAHATSGASDDLAEVFVGQDFLRLVNCLRVYRAYINNYDRAVNALSACLEKPSIRAWIDEQRDTYKTLSLASILITPIQRIPRYSLLLQELIQHMSHIHIDYRNVNRALEGIMAVADYLEEGRTKTEQMNEVLIAEEKLSGCPFQLVTPSRSLIMSGEVMQGEQQTKIYHLFLFNDILIQTIPKRRKFSFARLFELQQINVIDFPEGEAPLSFRVLTTDSGFTFICNSVEDKDKWVTQIKTTIRNLKQSQFTRQTLLAKREAK